MDEDESIVTLPNSDGALDLSNRSFVHLDPSVWSMGAALLELDISYNRMMEISPQIGKLEVLK
jgi:hypothetical protein